MLDAKWRLLNWLNLQFWNLFASPLTNASKQSINACCHFYRFRCFAFSNRSSPHQIIILNYCHHSHCSMICECHWFSTLVALILHPLMHLNCTPIAQCLDYISCCRLFAFRSIKSINVCLFWDWIHYNDHEIITLLEYYYTFIANYYYP